MTDRIRVSPLLLSLILLSLGIDCTQQIWGELRSSDDNGGYSYVFVGNLLQLNCTVNESSAWKAKDLIFTLKNDVYNQSLKLPEDEWVVLNNSTLQLNHNISGEEDAGEYSCQIKMPQDLLLVGSRQVYVQYLPQEVMEIHCEVKDWSESLKCSLDYGTRYVNNSNSNDFPTPDVSVTMVFSPSRNSTLRCPQPISAYNGRPQCVWPKRYFRAPPKFLLVVIVNNTVKRDQKMTSRWFTTDNIVRPSPAAAVWLTDVNSTCASLAWNHTKKYHSMFYRVNITAPWFSEVVNSSSATVCGLQPHRRYNVTVECRPLDNHKQPSGFWSEASSVTVHTSESVPGSSFPVHDGGYLLGPCRNGTRNATVFLEEVPADQQNGEIIGYHLQYDNRTVVVNVTSPSSAVVTNLACGSDFLVRIFARTRVGPSRSNARLRINTADGQGIPDFAVEMLDRGAKLVWNNGSSVGNNTDFNTTAADDDLTFFWCLRDNSTFDRTCKSDPGNVQRVVSPFEAGSVAIPQLSTDNLHTRTVSQNYLFGVSRGGRAIVWADCYFSPQAAMKAPDMSVKVINQRLDVDWNSQQCTEGYPVHTTGYRLYYCEQQQCHKEFQRVEVKAGQKTHYSMEGDPGSTYNISMQAVDFHGRLGPLSGPRVVAVPTPAASFPVWVFILVPVLLLSLLALWLGYKAYQKVSHNKAKFSLNYQSTLGAVEEQWMGGSSPSSSPPSPIWEPSLMDIDIEGTSCKTAVTDLDSEAPCPQGSSPLSHSQTSPAPQDFSQTPAGSEAPIVDDLAIPLTEFSTTEAATASAPLSVEGNLSRTLLPQVPLSAGVMACVPESPSVVGGRKAEYFRLPSVQSSDVPHLVGSESQEVPAHPQHVNPSFDSESEGSDQEDDTPLDFSMLGISGTRNGLPCAQEVTPASVENSRPPYMPTGEHSDDTGLQVGHQPESSVRQTDGSGDIGNPSQPHALGSNLPLGHQGQLIGIQNASYAPRPGGQGDVFKGIQGEGQPYTPRPDSLPSQNGDPPVLHSFMESPGAEESPNQSNALIGTKISQCYTPRPESFSWQNSGSVTTQQNTNQSYISRPDGMVNQDDPPASLCNCSQPSAPSQTVSGGYIPQPSLTAQGSSADGNSPYVPNVTVNPSLQNAAPASEDLPDLEDSSSAFSDGTGSDEADCSVEWGENSSPT